MRRFLFALVLAGAFMSVRAQTLTLPQSLDMQQRARLFGTFTAGTNYAYGIGWLAGSNAVWSIPPVILGPTNGTEGDTLTFSNAMFSAWSGNVAETNYCTFTNVLSNGTVSQQVQTVTLNNGRATGTKQIIVTPAPVVAAFSGTPTSGQPPLAVLFTNTSSGTITNALWTFGDGGTSNTLARSVSYTYAGISTNTVSLAVAGYSASTLAKTNYITAVSNALGSLAFDGLQNYARTDGSTNLVFASAYTWEGWFYCTNVPAIASALMFNRADFTGSGVLIQAVPANSKVQGYVTDSSGELEVTCPIIADATGFYDGSWHHLALVWDGTNYTCFGDGVAGTPVAGTGPVVNTNVVTFGKSDAIYIFAGDISATRISSVARYSTNFTPTASWSADTNTSALWIFGADTGASPQPDSSGNGNNLTLYGDPAPTWSTNSPP